MQIKKWFVIVLVGSIAFVSGMSISFCAAEEKFDSAFFVGDKVKSIPKQVYVFTEYKLLPSSVFEFNEDIKKYNVILSKDAITFQNATDGIGLRTRYMAPGVGIIEEDIMIMGHQSALSDSTITEPDFVLHYYTLPDNQIIIMFEFCDNAYKNVMTILKENMQYKNQRGFSANMIEKIYISQHFSTVAKLLAFVVYSFPK